MKKPRNSICPNVITFGVFVALILCSVIPSSRSELLAPSYPKDKIPEPLAIGSSAPDFRLPGVDGQSHSLSEFEGSKVLVVVFTAVHCPTAEVYEERIKKLVSEYRPKGVS